MAYLWSNVVVANHSGDENFSLPIWKVIIPLLIGLGHLHIDQKMITTYHILISSKNY